MKRTSQGPRSYEVVADALRANRADFERFVRARVPAEEADDVAQVAAMRALERADSLKDPERVIAWIYRIHRNVITDIMRSRVSEQRVLSKSADIPERPQLQAEDWCGCSVSQVKTINSSYATILGLVDVKGKPLSEAARTLGISINNASVRLHRARAALKKRMLDHCGVSSLRDCIDCRCVYDGCCAV